MTSGRLPWRSLIRSTPKGHGLAVQEVLPGQVLEVVEDEVLGALDVARVPAGVVEGRPAPAQRLGQGPDPGVRDVVDLVGGVDDPVERDPRLVHQRLVIRPALLDPAGLGGHPPVPVTGPVAQDVADARAVQVDRGAPDHVEVDVHGLGHGVADVADDPVDADGRPLAPGRIDRHRGRHLEERQPPCPGDVLGDVQGLAAAQPDDRLAGGQVGHDPVEVGALQRGDEAGARRARRRSRPRSAARGRPS